jgi:hypothetical protein
VHIRRLRDGNVAKTFPTSHRRNPSGNIWTNNFTVYACMIKSWLTLGYFNIPQANPLILYLRPNSRIISNTENPLELWFNSTSLDNCLFPPKYKSDSSHSVSHSHINQYINRALLIIHCIWDCPINFWPSKRRLLLITSCMGDRFVAWKLILSRQNVLHQSRGQFV